MSRAEDELTHRDAEALTEKLAFQPMADDTALAETISKASHSDKGSDIHEATGLDPNRINLATRSTTTSSSWIRGDHLAKASTILPT